jgi:hypothetical protein
MQIIKHTQRTRGHYLPLQDKGMPHKRTHDAQKVTTYRFRVKECFVYRPLQRFEPQPDDQVVLPAQSFGHCLLLGSYRSIGIE